jgi:mannose-6-phosphate isomerase-like protein (cupin superfamily)
MEILREMTAPRYQRDNITSYLLVSAGTCDTEHLTITLVEMAPGGLQRLHAHEPEQTYFILEGSGMMTVGSERRPVQAGDCVFIPSNSPHGLENTGGAILRYLSAASPSFTKEECAQFWPLPSLEEAWI